MVRRASRSAFMSGWAYISAQPEGGTGTEPGEARDNCSWSASPAFLLFHHGRQQPVGEQTLSDKRAGRARRCSETRAQDCFVASRRKTAAGLAAYRCVRRTQLMSHDQLRRSDRKPHQLNMFPKRRSARLVYKPSNSDPVKFSQVGPGPPKSLHDKQPVQDLAILL